MTKYAENVHLFAFLCIGNALMLHYGLSGGETFFAAVLAIWFIV